MHSRASPTILLPQANRSQRALASFPYNLAAAAKPVPTCTHYPGKARATLGELGIGGRAETPSTPDPDLPWGVNVFKKYNYVEYLYYPYYPYYP